MPQSWAEASERHQLLYTDRPAACKWNKLREVMTVVESRMQWEIYLPSWIIQDGNYDDFHRGHIATFAVECWAPLHHSNTHLKLADHIGHARYHINGEVVYAVEQGAGPGRSNLWVIDFGIRAYRSHREDTLPEWVAVGEYVAGDIGLGIDPYDYMEFHHTWPDILPLIYTWHIDRISQMSAPWIPTNTPWGSAAQERDMARMSYIDLDQTHAWDDEGGHAEYILHCTLLNSTPTMPGA